MRRWRIYYGSGALFTNEDGTPWEAPRVDVQAIAQPNERTGWHILHSADAYYYEDEREGWNKADGFTKWDHLIRAPQPLLVFGRMLPGYAYQKVLERAQADLAAIGEPKTGRHEDERQ